MNQDTQTTIYIANAGWVGINDRLHREGVSGWTTTPIRGGWTDPNTGTYYEEPGVRVDIIGTNEQGAKGTRALLRYAAELGEQEILVVQQTVRTIAMSTNVVPIKEPA